MECRDALAVSVRIAGQIITVDLGCVVLGLPVRISWISWMHRVQLQRAGSAMVGRSERIGLVIKYRLVQLIGLHHEHSMGANRKILRDLALGFRCLSIRAFRFGEKVWESVLLEVMAHFETNCTRRCSSWSILSCGEDIIGNKARNEAYRR